MYPSFNVRNVGSFVVSSWGIGVFGWKSPVGVLWVVGVINVNVVGWFFVMKSLIHSLAICSAVLFNSFHP
jgi:hypothetical protein